MSGRWYEAPSSYHAEDFSSLIKLAKGSGGYAIKMASGNIPDIFRTTFENAHYGEVTVLDDSPFVAGLRNYFTANGNGAACQAIVTQADIDRAVVEGRLSEPVPADYTGSKESAEPTPQEPSFGESFSEWANYFFPW